MRSSAAIGPSEGPSEDVSDDVEATVDETELVLVRAARAGEGSAFQRLYARYRGAVRAVVLSSVGWQDCDDLTQDVFLVAWQRMDQLRDEARFGPWLLSCARNRCTDHHRRARSVVPVSDAMPALRAAMPPKSEALEVLRAIQLLPASYRETLVMRLVEGMSGPEIAAQTGLTPRSVRVNLHRGLKKLRSALGEGPKGEGR